MEQQESTYSCVYWQSGQNGKANEIKEFPFNFLKPISKYLI